MYFCESQCPFRNTKRKTKSAQDINIIQTPKVFSEPRRQGSHVYQCHFFHIPEEELFRNLRGIAYPEAFRAEGLVADVGLLLKGGCCRGCVMEMKGMEQNVALKGDSRGIFHNVLF